jgi:DNA-nicking Smr family endonuclease
MDSWLNENAIIDKDAGAGRRNQIPGENRRRLLHGKPDDILDIHGLSNDKAWLSLDLFFNRAKSCGFEKIRIIHGKGNHSMEEATLGRTVRAFIEQCPFAGESGFEKSSGGGSGATWVLLKET